MNPRYFIGVSLPDEVTTQIVKIQDSLISEETLMKPLVPHITLLYPNILMTVSPLYMVPKVRELAKSMLPISITLLHTSMFDKRVFYIDVVAPELHILRQELLQLLPPDVMKRYNENRDFTPHITIAQAQPMKILSSTLINQLQQEVNALLPKTFQINEIHYFRSHGNRLYKPTAI